MKILITGASSGIGFLSGCVLASRGHNVYMTTKTEEEAKVLREKIDYLQLNVNIFKLDITVEYKKIEELDLDVLFLHAGVGYTGLLKDIDINLLKDNFEVNVFSNLRMIQTYLNNQSPDNKRVVMTSSLLANHSYPFFGSYIMSKTCIEMMMNILRKEEVFTPNQFIVIRPGAYHTGFNQYMILSGEKSGMSYQLRCLINRLFLILEKKNLNSIVCEVVEAIEKGNRKIYSAPKIQAFLSKLT